MPMFVESAFKAVHGGCIYYNVRKIVPSVDNAVTDCSSLITEKDHLNS